MKERLELSQFQVKVWESSLDLATREFLIRLTHISAIDSCLELSRLLSCDYWRLNYQVAKGSPDISLGQILAAKRNLPNLDFQITPKGVSICHKGSSVPILRGDVSEYITRAYSAKAARV